jgi:hypothetical protein
MAPPSTHKERVNLYIRMILGAGLLGIAFGYYFKVIGRIGDMTTFLHFSFAVRGMIIGALFWLFEIFWVNGPRGKKLRDRSYGSRMAIKVVVYVVLIEAGFLIGEALFSAAGDVK